MTLSANPPVASDLVHHIGIAVASLDESIEFYRGLFGFKPGEIIVREDIGVRGCFVPVGETNLELLEGINPRQPDYPAHRAEGRGPAPRLLRGGGNRRQAQDPGRAGHQPDRQGAPHRPDGRRHRLPAPVGSPWRADRAGPAQPLAQRARQGQQGRTMAKPVRSQFCLNQD